MSLQAFEEHLKEQEFGLEAELKSLKIQYRNRVDGIRAQTSFRIEALEAALIETKLQQSKQREQAEMQLAEMESKVYNAFLDNSSDELKRVEDVEKELLNNDAF